MDERRQNIRINKSLEVRYRISNNFLRSGSRSVDVSRAGMRLPTIQRLEPGTILELEIHSLETNKPIVATGEVVWLNKKPGERFPFEIGIKFIKIAPSDSEIFSRICRRLQEEDSTDIRWVG